MDRFIKESAKLEWSQRLAARSLALMPAFHKIPPKIFRLVFFVMERIFGLKKVDVEKIVDYLIPITADPSASIKQPHKIKIRAYYPTDNTTASEAEQKRSLVYFHGGGCVVGSIETHDRFCRYLAKHSNMNIISVDYRLAPEHKFPLPIYDAIDAWNWINLHHKQLNLHPDYIGVGGDSAGAYLACLIGQTSLQTDFPMQAKTAPYFQVLLYPMLDLQGVTESYHKFNKHLILTNKLMDYFRGHYLHNLDNLDLATISPLQNKDLSLSPNTYILTLGYDPLRDDGLAYAERLQQAGIQLNHQHFSDCMHAFISVTAMSKRAREATHIVATALTKFNH